MLGNLENLDLSKGVEPPEWCRMTLVHLWQQNRTICRPLPDIMVEADEGRLPGIETDECGVHIAVSPAATLLAMLDGPAWRKRYPAMAKPTHETPGWVN